MANDLIDYSPGGLQPYAPADQPLVPVHDGWGDLPVDYLTDHSPTPAGATSFFGNALPVGVTEQQFGQLVTQISALFMSDLSQLGHKLSTINAAVQWFQNNAGKPPRQEPRRHNYNLHDQAHDPVANSFANHMAAAGATQKFIDNALWWINELAKRIDGNAASHIPPAQGRAPSSTSAKAYENSLSDAEYNRLHDINLHAAARTESILRQRWGQSYERNIAATNEFLAGLPEREREALDRYTTGGVHFLNSVEGIELLFNQAIGGNNLPRGGGLQTEIQAIENLMRTNRRAYNNDERLQARYRTLLDLRDGT